MGENIIVNITGGTILINIVTSDINIAWYGVSSRQSLPKLLN